MYYRYNCLFAPNIQQFTCASPRGIAQNICFKFFIQTLASKTIMWTIDMPMCINQHTYRLQAYNQYLGHFSPIQFVFFLCDKFKCLPHEKKCQITLIDSLKAKGESKIRQACNCFGHCTFSFMITIIGFLTHNLNFELLS